MKAQRFSSVTDHQAPIRDGGRRMLGDTPYPMAWYAAPSAALVTSSVQEATEIILEPLL